MKLSFVVLSAVFLGGASAATNPQDVKFISTYKPAGMQSGPDKYGGTFVSSVAYSARDNSVILTGSTWGRFFESAAQVADEDFDQYGQRIDNPRIDEGCFIATASLPGGEDAHPQLGVQKSDLFWSHKQRIRAPSANNVCNDLQLFEDTKSVVVVAHAEERKNHTVSEDVTEEETDQYGMLLDFDWNVVGDKSFKTVGGQVLKDEKELYPVATTSLSQYEKDGMFVVFMEAKNEATHTNIVEGQQQHMATDYFSYGSGYGMSIVRLDFKTKQITPKTSTKFIEHTWLKHYELNEGSSGEVYVADIAHVSSGLLLVAGSISGQGDAFGNSITKGNYLDGFITKINPGSGKPIFEAGHERTARIHSITKNSNVYVSGFCHDPNDTEHVYVTGSTDGQLLQGISIKGTSAFLMKLNVLTMTPIWTKQQGSKASSRRHKSVTRGMACSVSPDGESVWFGGAVEDGHIPESGLQKGYGGTDIFVSKAVASTGEFVMVKQLGTDMDDELAKLGGLVTDKRGNAVVIGNTYGSFYRERSADEKEADVFVLTLDMFNGEIMKPFEVDDSSNSSITALGAIPLVAFAFSVAAALYVSRRRRSSSSFKSSNSITDRSQVTSYLGGFDVEHLELKHSATGGWHCNFVGDLAEGKYVPQTIRSRPSLTSNNSSELPDSLMRAPLTNSKDSFLFCDADADLTLDDSLDSSARSNRGLLDGNDLTSAYGDLVGAYNSTWRDRTQNRDSSCSEGRKSWGKDIV